MSLDSVPPTLNDEVNAKYESIETGSVSMADTKVIETGDILFLGSFTAVGSRIITGTNTAYRGEEQFIHFGIRPDIYFPGNATAIAVLHTDVVKGDGETVDVRIFDTYAGEAVAEFTDASHGGNQSFGPVEHTFSSPASPREMAVEFRTNPGSNQLTIRDTTVHLGVQL